MTNLSTKRSVIGLALLMLILLVPLIGFAAPVSAQGNDKVSVIVGFKGPNNIETLKEHGVQVICSYTNINAVAASVPTWEIEALKRSSNVAYVENDDAVYAVAQPPQWGVAKIEAPIVWAGGNKGTGIKVAVLDTGIDIFHPDLKVVGGATFVAGTSSYNDDNGHGTHCAGIIAALDNNIGVVGVAPEASMYAVKVLDKVGSGSISNIINGIEWSIANGMQVISMSLGTTFNSAALKAECDKAYNAGIVLVAAAGNSGTNIQVSNTILYPAKYSSVIAVGATDSNDEIARWSSRGPEMSVSAPGVNIYSTYNGRSYTSLSGTSMACPYVAGTVALILEDTANKPTNAKAILQATAVDLGPKGPDPAYGYGRINASAAATPVESQIKDFTISVSPSGMSIPAGSSGSSSVTISSISGFSGTISFSTSAPPQWTAEPSPTSKTLESGGIASSTITVTVPNSATAGAYPLTISGISGSISHLVTVTVNVPTSLTVPSAPQNLKASAGNSQIALSWTTPSNNGGSTISNYKIYRHTPSTTETLLAEVGNVLAYKDAAVSKEQTYYYRVAAVNSVGESSLSNEAYTKLDTEQVKAMNVAVTTDKQTYSQGSTVYITIKVTESTTGKGLSGALVVVKLYNPYGLAVASGSGRTDLTGTLRCGYKQATTNQYQKGTFTISAVVSLAGYPSGTGKTAFTFT